MKASVRRVIDLWIRRGQCAELDGWNEKKFPGIYAG